MRRTLARIAVPGVLALAVSLAGCGGDDDDAAPEKGGGTSSSPGESPSVNSISPPNLPIPPDVADKAGAVADITFDECPTGEGKQSVTGSVTNPTKKTASYVITFNWINDTSDVLGRGFTVIRDLDGGDSADWELTAKVVDGASQCVPNVLRGRVAKD